MKLLEKGVCVCVVVATDLHNNDNTNSMTFCYAFHSMLQILSKVAAFVAAIGLRGLQSGWLAGCLVNWLFVFTAIKGRSKA